MYYAVRVDLSLSSKGHVWYRKGRIHEYKMLCFRANLWPLSQEEVTICPKIQAYRVSYHVYAHRKGSGSLGHCLISQATLLEYTCHNVHQWVYFHTSLDKGQPTLKGIPSDFWHWFKQVKSVTHVTDRRSWHTYTHYVQWNWYIYKDHHRGQLYLVFCIGSLYTEVI